MIYNELDLKTTGILLGSALIVCHLIALFKSDQIKPLLKDFPRNRTAGIALMALNSLWAFWIISTMDLGEFQAMRGKILIAIPIAFVLVVRFVEEFLAVRALGCFLLLFACVILDAAWFKFPETFPQSKLLLPAIAYVWIVIGMFWVGMPYVMRDQVSWLTQHGNRWKGACLGGMVYGVLTLGCAVAFY